jgi:ubiquinone/menaquinone biosynthesis C-methylase UbiE
MKKDYANEILEMSRSGYEEIARNFSQTRKVFWEELNFLGNYIKDGDEVLDIGCGNGRFLEVLNGKVFQYTGIDNSESLISYAKKWQGDKGKFVCASALDLPFENKQFDAAVSFGVLHHIPSKKYRGEFLNEAHRVLKKDGLLILTVWNLWNNRITPVIKKHAVQKLLGKSKLDFKDVFLPFGKKEGVRYLHAFTKGELKKLLQNSGFKIEDFQIISRRGKNENIVAVCKKI